MNLDKVIIRVGTTSRFGARYYIKYKKKSGGVYIEYVSRRKRVLDELEKDDYRRQVFLYSEYCKRGYDYPICD